MGVKVQKCAFTAATLARDRVECESRWRGGAIRRLAFVDADLSLQLHVRKWNGGDETSA